MDLTSTLGNVSRALGVGPTIGETIGPQYKPLHSICEYLNALHIYAEDARRGVQRHVEAHHFCTHVNKNLRQCLIYDSNSSSARLIGVEYMIPKAIYETLDPEEQKLWHSHEYEVKSGMLVIPTLSSGSREMDVWEKMELQAMKEVIGLYGKTWHFWQVDKGHEIPLGTPQLMGSLTRDGQIDLDEVLKERNERLGVDRRNKAEKRKGIEGPGVHENADPWWKESTEKHVVAAKEVAN